MTPAVVTALAVSVVFTVLGPRLGRRLPPAAAVRLLVPASLLSAASTVFVLAVVAFTWLGQLPAVAAVGPWSADRLRRIDPIPAEVAIVSAVLLTAVAAWCLRVGIRRCRALLAVHRACHRLGAPGTLVVLDSDRPDAFTTPEANGRIVVTTAMLRALTTAERRALLAHEGSHVAHRHAWWTLTADLAAAADPLLRPTARAVHRAVERWADEDAAIVVADRRLVARAVARAALTRHRTGGRPAAVPAATGGEVPERVRALLGGRPQSRPALGVLLALLTAATVLAALAVERGGEHLFEHATNPQASTTTSWPADGPFDHGIPPRSAPARRSSVGQALSLSSR